MLEADVWPIGAMKGTERISIDEAPVSPPSHAGVRVSIRDLGHSFGELDVLVGLNIDLPPHSVLGLVGPSGCGKSTFLEILCGLRQPTTGAVGVDGEMDAALRRSKCAFMPQRDVLLPWYSALDNAALALRNGGIRPAAARREAAELFSHFGLSGFERARPGHLSGGMRQRVAFLRTLLSGKPVLALDEPFAALDAITRAEMQEWLAGALSTHPRTTVLVSHDLEEALYLCDLVIVLSARPGRIAASMCSPAPRASDRNAAVTEPAFVASREEAMRALRKGAS